MRLSDVCLELVNEAKKVTTDKEREDSVNRFVAAAIWYREEEDEEQEEYHPYAQLKRGFLCWYRAKDAKQFERFVAMVDAYYQFNNNYEQLEKSNNELRRESRRLEQAHRQKEAA
jgi:hypothetical protein